MTKPPKTNFFALIADQVAPAARTESEPAALAPTPVSLPEAVTPRAKRKVAAPVGQGTLKERAHQLSLYLEAPVYDALREIAHVERTKLHPLILEGIDLLLRKRGAASIKELTKKSG